MALTREQREVEIKLAMADFGISYERAAAEVDAMDAQGVFSGAGEAVDLSGEYVEQQFGGDATQDELDELFAGEVDDDIPTDTGGDPTQDELDELFAGEDGTPTQDELDELFADEEPMPEPTSVYGQAAWADTDDELTAAPVEPVGSVARPIEPTPSFADGGLERGLEASTQPFSPLTPLSPEELSQREFEQRHKDRYAPQRQAVKDVVSGAGDLLSEASEWMGKTFTAPENVGQYDTRDSSEEVETKGAVHPQALSEQGKEETPFQQRLQALDPRKAKAEKLSDIVAIETDDGVVAHWEEVVEGKARKIYIKNEGRVSPDEARSMAYDEHMGDVTEGAVNFATLFIPGVAPARWAVAFMQMGLKGRVAALTAAGMTESVAAGVAGNLAAGRPWNEGIKEDAAWGAVFAGGASVVGEGVEQTAKYFGRKATDKLEEGAERLVREGTERADASKGFEDAKNLKEVVKDLKKGPENYDPEQLSRAIATMPDGELKDQMRALLRANFGEDAAIAQKTAKEFFSDSANINKLDNVADDIDYKAVEVLDKNDSTYTALARLMEEGRLARAAVDTSYIDETGIGKFGRQLEDKLLAGIPSKVRSIQFNKAQDSVRSNAVDLLDKEMKRVNDKLNSGERLAEGAVKGMRHQLREMKQVRTALKEGKEIKASWYAKASQHFDTPGLKTELDNVQALQQYSKFTKASASEPIVDVATATTAQGIFALITGGAYWGAQLATGVAIPALRNLSQVGRKNVITKANDLVKKHKGDMTAIRKDISEMRPGEGENVLAALLFRLETSAQGGNDDKEFNFDFDAELGREGMYSQ